MSSAPTSRAGKCPECGAAVTGPGTRCWLCRGSSQPAALKEEAVPAIVLDWVPYDRRAAYQFSISTLLLIMTLTTVLAGISAMAAGLGIALAFLTVPALVRTCMIVARRKQHGEQVPAIERVSTFASTFGLVMLLVIGTVIGGIVALFAMCFSFSMIGGF